MTILTELLREAATIGDKWSPDLGAECRRLAELAASVPAPDLAALPDAITTPMGDVVPVPRNCTMWPVMRAGKASDPATWNLGRVPNRTDCVAVHVPLVIDRLEAFSVLPLIDDALVPTYNFDLQIGTLVNLPSMKLTIGTDDAPATGTITVLDVPMDNTKDRRFQNGLVSLGRVRMCGTPLDSFVSLVSAVRAGDNTLSLASPAFGWKAGDRLALPGTKQLDVGQPATANHYETATIKSISEGRLTVMLQSPVQYDHPAVYEWYSVQFPDPMTIVFSAHPSGPVPLAYPVVLNLSRSLTIRSENPLGTRGICIFTNTSRPDMCHVAFRDLGRSRNDTPNDAGGMPPDMGQYCGPHMHHLMDDSTIDPIENPGFLFEAIAIDGGDGDHPFRGGVIIHDSRRGVVRDSCIYNVAGAGIVGEDQFAVANLIEDNCIVRLSGLGSTSGSLRDDGGRYPWRNGDGVWLANPANKVLDNQVINSSGHAYTIYPGTAKDISKRTGGFLQFERNTAIACRAGLTFWNLNGDASSADFTRPMSWVEEFHAYHCWEYAVGLLYPAHVVGFDSLVVRNDPAAKAGYGSIGFDPGDYTLSEFKLKNVDLQGVRIGIRQPVRALPPLADSRGTFAASNVFVAPTECAIECRTMHATGAPRGKNIPPKMSVVDGFMWAPMKAGAVSWRMRMLPDATSQPPGINWVQTDIYQLLHYQGDAAANYRIYFLEQSPDVIVPQTGTRGNILNWGCPEPGLNNTQAMAAYGIAIAGAIAGATQIARSEIIGLVCPLDADGEGEAAAEPPAAASPPPPAASAGPPPAASPPLPAASAGPPPATSPPPPATSAGGGSETALPSEGNMGISNFQFEITEYVVPGPSSIGLYDGICAGRGGRIYFTEYGKPGQFPYAPNRVSWFDTVTEKFTQIAVGDAKVAGSGAESEGISIGPDGDAWWVEFNGKALGHMRPDGTYTRFPAADSRRIVLGPDGNLWFTCPIVNAIGRASRAGVISYFPLPSSPAKRAPWGITVGPDDNIWFCGNGSHRIGVMNLGGTLLREFFPPTLASGPLNICSGPAGKLWFTEWGTQTVPQNRVGCLDPATGSIQEIVLPTAGCRPWDIVAAGDGNLYCTESGADKLAQITPKGVVTEIPTPTQKSRPHAICLGLDGAIWFTQFFSNRIARMV